MTFLIVLGYIVFVLALAVGVLGTLVGLPGTILILADAVIFSACTHWQRPSWWVLLILALLSLIAETSDNLLSMVGTRYGGGSNRTGWIALVGGIAGALIGSWLSPLFSSIGLLGGVVGFVLGVLLVPLLLAVAGAYLAVYLYELRQGKTPSEAQRVAKGALLGRLLGAMAKTVFAAIMASTTLWVVFTPLLHK